MRNNYGVKAPVRTLKQRKSRIVEELEYLENFDSFDVEFSPSGQVHQKTRYNMAGQVTGFDQYAYYQTGELAECIPFNAEVRETERTRVEQPDEKHRVIISTQIPSGEVIARTVEIYDGGLLASPPHTTAETTEIRAAATEELFRRYEELAGIRGRAKALVAEN